MTKSILKPIGLFICCFSLITSCNSDDDSNSTASRSVSDFVWKGMNTWYFWQDSQDNLADSKDDNEETYNNFLNSFDSPQELFESLKNSADDFSWFIEDYVEQQQSFQGISTSFGFRRSFVRIGNTENVAMYINQVDPNSPAALAGFERGDIINAINGTTITVDNFNTVVSTLNQTTVSFSFTENDGVTFIENKTITQTVIQSNPVHFSKVFDNIASRKVGYLVYNSFSSSFNDELNEAFGNLKNEGINELVLDLRLNGGGSVNTSAFLASMIYGQANSDTNFAELRFNSKQADRNSFFNFSNSLFVLDSDGNFIEEQNINRLSSLNRLYVITSRGTASASELIINGLRPFMEVILIGETTLGKNEGSITVYDSPSSNYTDVDTANPEHNMAMQPIVSQAFNSIGESDYTLGFIPNITIQETNFWNNILPFGDENEVLLKAALDNIRGIASKAIVITEPSERMEEKSLRNKFETTMYSEPNLLE